MANIYVQAFKELIVNEVLRKAKEVFKAEEYQEIHAEARLAEVGVGLKGMK